MAAAADIDIEELQICMKGILIATPTVVKANYLQRECEKEIGKPFPFRQLGFPTFIDYLKSIPNIVKLEPYDGYNPDVYPIASKASSHIDQLVSRQRVAPSRRRGVSRRGSFNSRPPLRRRTTRVAPRPPPPVARPRPNQVDQDTVEQLKVDQDKTVQDLDPNFMRHILWDLVKKLAILWKSGIDVRDLESYMTGNYDKRDLTRNGLHSVDNLLSHAEGMVERGDTKVYPKLAGASNNTDQQYKVNGIPAGDEFDDYDEEYDYEIEDEEAGKDSEEELSKKTIQLWSRALGVEGNGATPRSSRSEEEILAPDSRQEMFDQNVDLPDDDSNISSIMINNFRKILNNHTDGIWASQLQQLYFEQFRVTLDLLDLGHTSAISLASSLPSVFTFKREGSHDWKLYDARYVTQESLDAQENGAKMLLSENERYIPQTIIDNIKKLLDDNANGFRSTDLLDMYQKAFRKPLDLGILGFNTLEEFLMILKDDVTLKKVFNYYLLLPKHKVVSFEALEPPSPDERLIVPAESLCALIPENVLRPGEEIPLQELPPVEMDPSPDRPLLELEVRVAEVISPVFFYMTLDNTYEELENMMDDLEKYYTWEESNFQIPLPVLAMNLYCAAKFQGYWHRAKITRIKNHGDVEIEYIDYGTPATVKNSELRFLSKEFATLPAQAICAKLIGVKPLNGEAKFPQNACAAFLKFVEGKRLVAHVYQVASRVRKNQERMQLELIMYDVQNSEAEIVVNDYLIEKRLASPINEVEDSCAEIEQPAVPHIPDINFIYNEENGSSLPSLRTSLSGNDSSSLLGNGSTSLPISSVNRFRKLSLTMKHYVTSRFALRSSVGAQSILNRYTTAKCSVPEENHERGSGEKQCSDTSIPVANGLANGSVNESKHSVSDTSLPVTNGLTNGLANGSMNESKQSVSDSSLPVTNGLTNGLANGSMNESKQSVSDTSLPVTNGLTNGLANGSMNESKQSFSDTSLPVTNGLANGSVNESKQSVSDTSDSFDVSHILAQIKKKKLNNLFGVRKANVNESKSKVDLSQKENINTVNTLNSNVLTNGTSKSSSFTCSTPESSNLSKTVNTPSLENVANNDTASADSIPVQTTNESETPKNITCERKLELDFSNEGYASPVVEACLSNSDMDESKSNYSNEIDVKAIVQKTKERKLKNLFGKPTPPKIGKGN